MQIDRLKKLKGPDGLVELKKVYGKPLNFAAFNNYPTFEEEELINACLKIVYPTAKFTDPTFEAGRFHIRTFLDSPYGKVLWNTAPKDIKAAIKYSSVALKPVISEMEISFIDTGKKSAKIIMKNSGYALHHFEGVWKEIMETKFKDLNPRVSSREMRPGEHEYFFAWD